jgi:hypothetical protein
MWKYLILPESLFAAGTLQAILPYLVWYLTGSLTEGYSFRVGYIPLVIYVLGFLMFFLGCRLAPDTRDKTPFLESRVSIWNVVTYGLWFCVIANIVQMYGAYKVYGTIPLLSFGDKLSIQEADEMLANSGVGQMAIFYVFKCLLANFMTLRIIERIRRGNFSWYNLDFIIPALLVVAVTTMGGKRQSLVMAVFFCGLGLLVYYRDSVNMLMQRVVSKVGAVRYAYLLIGLVSCYAGFEYIGKMRSGRDIEIITDYTKIEAFRYLELPLLNFEYQSELAGYGPIHFAPVGVLKTLLPKRMMEEYTLAETPRLELTSPAGFYGELHWHTGIWGCLLFAFASGAFCRLLYNNSHSGPFWLFSYTQCAWTLFTCHSYNHFFNLVFLPLPLVAYLMMCVTIFPWKNTKSVVFVPNRLKKQTS